LTNRAYQTAPDASIVIGVVFRRSGDAPTLKRFLARVIHEKNLHKQPAEVLDESERSPLPRTP